MEGRQVFASLDRDLVVPFPERVQKLLAWWSPRRLNYKTKWIPDPPSLTLVTDASDLGWGYQSSEGHQGQGLWEDIMLRKHINVKELKAVYIAIRKEPTLRCQHVKVLTDNTTTVYCINRQGSSRSPVLLQLSEKLFRLAQIRKLHLSAVHLPGKLNSWSDALSRQTSTAVNWTLKESVFRELTRKFGNPEVDLFASTANHKLPLFL